MLQLKPLFSVAKNPSSGAVQSRFLCVLGYKARPLKTILIFLQRLKIGLETEISDSTEVPK
jgi:hypothetical protein